MVRPQTTGLSYKYNSAHTKYSVYPKTSIPGCKATLALDAPGNDKLR